jgi:zinc protease
LRDSFLTATTYGSKKDTQEFVKRVQSLAPLEAAHPQKQEANSKTTSTLECINIPSKQNIEFSIGGSLPITIHHPDYPAFLMGISVLGMWGGFTGRLMSTVREKEGLTYGIYARIEGLQFGETGYWRIMTFFSPTLAETGLRSTFREIKLLLEKGVTAAELKRFKAILKSRQLLSRDSAVGYTARLHEYKLRNIAPNEIEAFEEQVQKLTSDSVNEALRKYLVPDTVLVIGAGPTESVAKALRAVNNEIR